MHRQTTTFSLDNFSRLTATLVPTIFSSDRQRIKKTKAKNIRGVRSDNFFSRTVPHLFGGQDAGLTTRTPNSKFALCGQNRKFGVLVFYEHLSWQTNPSPKTRTAQTSGTLVARLRRQQ